MKRGWCILAAALLLSGCAAGKGTGNQAKTDSHWVVEPSIEADNIDAIPLSRGNTDPRNYNAIGMHAQDGLSLIQKGELYGLIDYSGKQVVDCVYRSIFIGYQGKYLLENNDGYFTLDTDNRLVKLDENAATDIRGTAPNMGLCWIADEQKLFIYGGGDSTVWGQYQTTEPVAALFSPSVAQDANGNRYLELGMKTEFVLTDGAKPVSETKYQGCGSFSDGIIPMEQGEKWGYIDAHGQTVIPFQYETCWQNGAYNASSGYVVLFADGKYALYDANGNCVADFGTFQQIRPVYNGNFWVEKDGKWGVWNIYAE